MSRTRASSLSCNNPMLDFENQLSPYYTDAHREYRLHARQFVQTHISPFADKWAKQEKIDDARALIKKFVAAGGMWFFPYGFEGSTWKGHEWDPFFEIIFYQEMAEPALFTGLHIHYIAVDPIIHFGKHPVHAKALEEIKNGDKLVCLAISEVDGGSDVARIATTAKLTDDGQNYVINGNKYWITAGCRSDYFVTLVRTGPVEDGRNAVSLILIPRQKGVFTSHLKLQGNAVSDTAAVTFHNVIVPKENIIGNVNEGFRPLMINFNLERFGICCNCVSSARVCVTESINWAKERKTFGKPLIKHQVIRHKIANMSREVVACQALLERVAFQLKHDRFMKKDKSIARNVALLKVQSTKMYQLCTIESSQIFGGRSYVRGGRGGKVERLYRHVRAAAIYGGSEEIMLDLAVRQAKL